MAVESNSSPPRLAAVTAFQQWQANGAGDASTLRDAFPDEPDFTTILLDLQGFDPSLADLFADALTNMPAVGEEFLGFELLDELGFECESSILLSLRNSIYQYLEDNARDNMDIDVTSFEEKLPGDQEIPHQSPDKYWDDYH